MTNNWYARKLRNPIKIRGHVASMITLANGVLARQAPNVSFVHDFPGSIKTGFGRESKVVMAVFNAVWGLGVRFLSPDECGENHVFFCTSAAYPPAAGAGAAGVALADAVTTVTGYDGKRGSGNYSIDEKGESASKKVQELLAGMIKKGVQDKLWQHTEAEFVRLCG